MSIFRRCSKLLRSELSGELNGGIDELSESDIDYMYIT